MYGRDRVSKDARQRWAAMGIDVLMGMYGKLKVCVRGQSERNTAHCLAYE